MPDPFLNQLIELCREEPIRPKWVFVPTPGLRWTWSERMLMEGHNWVNLRLVTPLSMALEAVAPSLLERHINPTPESLGPSLMQSLLTSSQHFGPVLGFPGTAEALWSSLCQFRMAGLRAHDLERLPPSLRRDELLRLFSAYEAHLEEHRLADRAMLFSHPPEHLPIGSQDPVLIYPYHRWSELELNWMSRVPGRKRTPRAALPAGSTPGWVERQVEPVEAVQPTAFCAPRRREEVETILDQLVSRGGSLDQVEIAARVQDWPLLADRAAALGFACTFESGLPVLSTRPGQAVARILRWLDSDCSAYHLSELMSTQLLRGLPDSYRAARLLERAQIRSGRESYFCQLDALQPGEGEAPFREWLQKLFQRFPLGQGEIGFSRWLTGLQETLEQDFPLRGLAENGVRTALLQTLEEMKQLPIEVCTVEHWAAQVEQRLQSLRVLASRPRPGALHVCAVESLGLSGRTIHHWIGMEEGNLVGDDSPDCVLSDAERQLLSPHLPLASQRRQDARQHLNDRLQTLPGQLFLSHALFDAGGEQEQLPAWELFARMRTAWPDLREEARLRRQMGEVRRPERPPTPSSPVLQRLFPWLGRGERAQRARLEPLFGIYDGLVLEAAGKWDPRLTGESISVSRLQSLANCPFQFFLEKGLGLRPPALEPPNADGWLDAATRGTVLHDVFAAYYRELRSRGWRPDRERDRQHLRDLLGRRLEHTRRVFPPPSAALEKAEHQALQREVEHFLTLELGQPERTPVGMEVPFGMEVEDGEPLASAQPVELVFSPQMTLRLRGRIDRIDRVPGGYGVVDYKTGKKLYTQSNQPHFDRGRLLQHALYALVATQLLERQGKTEPVVQSSYYFPTTAAERVWQHFPYPDPKRLEELLEKVLEPLASGAFIHTHEVEEDCRFCPYRAACEGPSSALRAKLEHPPNTQLEARRQLLQSP